MQTKTATLHEALDAAKALRGRAATIAARAGDMDCRELAEFLDLMQTLFLRVVPFTLLPDAQALAGREMRAPPADILAAIAAAQLAGQGVVFAYLTSGIPAPAAIYDTDTGFHAWGKTTKAERAALDAAIGGMISALDGLLTAV